MLDVMLDSFDHNDCVVHDETNRKDKSKKRECIDRKTQHRENGKRTDKRNGNGEERNEVARQFWRKRNTTMMTRTMASTKVVTISFMPSVIGRVVSMATTYSKPSGNRVSIPPFAP